MRSTIPWKPNESGAPDPFFMQPREYLEACNALVREKNEDIANGYPSVWNREEPYEIYMDFSVPFDPDAFDALTGHIVPISKRGGRRDDR